MQAIVPKTFSANSLKILDNDPSEYKLKYEDGLFFTKSSSLAKAGQNLHSLLCYYLKDFDISKIENALGTNDREFLDKIKTYETLNELKNSVEKQIEQSFLIKCTPPNNKKLSSVNIPENTFYLTGRFDAVLLASKQEQGTIKIYDWKTQNLPKNPEYDIQTIVYLYAGSKLYKTTDISITYIALSENKSITIPYNRQYDYLSRIYAIVNKTNLK